jgi:hypothetical protein
MVSASILPQGLEPALSHFADPSAAGWLVATNGRVQKRIAFEKGAAVFAVSNDPRDLMGQALLRTGLISEKDLTQALAMPRAPGESTPHLFTALVAMKKVTPEQTKVVFESKLRESVLDLFLWEAGSIEITAGEMGAGPVFPTRIPVPALLEEGPKRRTRWKAVRKAFPSFDVAFERETPWPAGFPTTPGDKRLAKLIEDGKTLAAILLELHGQDYAVAVRITSLFQKGILATRKPATFGEFEVDVPIDFGEAAAGEDLVTTRQVSAVPTGEFTRVEAMPSEDAENLAPGAFSQDLSKALLERASSLIKERQLEEALAVLTELIQNDPMAAGDAWTLMNVVEESIVADAEAAGLVKTATLTLARPAASFAGTVFPPDQAFVLSRFAAGKMTVGELLSLCPFPPVELYRVLRKFLDDKIIRRV